MRLSAKQARVDRNQVYFDLRNDKDFAAQTDEARETAVDLLHARVVGTVGGDLQERVTAIGDAVNIASRVERANKKARTELLVSEAVLREVQDKVRVGKSIYVRLPGKTGKYALHEVLGVRTAHRKTAVE